MERKMILENILSTVMTEIKNIAKTETIVGKPISAGDSTIIPVSKISFGFGGGGGGGKNNKDSKTNQDAEGNGIAGGAKVEPVAFIVITNGKAQLLSVNEKDSSLSKVIDIIPDIVSKFTNEKTNNDKKE